MKISVPLSYLMLIKYVFMTAVVGMMLGIVLSGVLALSNSVSGCGYVYDERGNRAPKDTFSWECWKSQARGNVEEGSTVGLVLGGIFGGFYALKKMKPE